VSCAAPTFPGNSAENVGSGSKCWVQNLSGPRVTKSEPQQNGCHAGISQDFCKSLQNNAWLFNQNAEEGRNLQNSHLCIWADARSIDNGQLKRAALDSLDFAKFCEHCFEHFGRVHWSMGRGRFQPISKYSFEPIRCFNQRLGGNNAARVLRCSWWYGRVALIARAKQFHVVGAHLD